MPKTSDYGSLHNEVFESHDHWKYKRSLSQIPEERSTRFERSLVTSVFSGRGVGAGAGSVERGSLQGITRKQLMVLLSVVYGNFWVAACVSLQAPFFPHEAEKKGATSTIYGLVFGVYELLIITMSPVFGKLITRVSPKFLIECGLFICGTSTVIFGVLDRMPNGSPFIISAFIVRIFEGVGAAAFLTSSYSLIGGEFPERVAVMFAMLETSFGLGLILGPTVGGALYEVGGYALPFVVLGSFLVIGGIVAFCSLPTSQNPHSGSSSQGMISFLSDTSTLLDAFATATSLNFIGFNAATFEPHLRQFSLTPVVTGCLFILTGAVYALTSPIMGKICEKGFNEKTLCLIGCVLVFCGSLFIGPLPFIPFQPTLWVIIISLLTIGLGLSAKLVSSFVDCLNYNIKVRGFPNDITTYGLVSALFFSSCSVGAFVGPSAGGYLLDHFGYRAASMYIVTVDALMIILFVGYKIYLKSTKEGRRKDRLMSTVSVHPFRHSQSVI